MSQRASALAPHGLAFLLYIHIQSLHRGFTSLSLFFPRHMPRVHLLQTPEGD